MFAAELGLEFRSPSFWTSLFISSATSSTYQRWTWLILGVSNKEEAFPPNSWILAFCISWWKAYEFFLNLSLKISLPQTLTRYLDTEQGLHQWKQLMLSWSNKIVVSKKLGINRWQLLIKLSFIHGNCKY